MGFLPRISTVNVKAYFYDRHTFAIFLILISVPARLLLFIIALFLPPGVYSNEFHFSSKKRSVSNSPFCREIRRNLITFFSNSNTIPQRNRVRFLSRVPFPRLFYAGTKHTFRVECTFGCVSNSKTPTFTGPAGFYAPKKQPQNGQFGCFALTFPIFAALTYQSIYNNARSFHRLKHSPRPRRKCTVFHAFRRTPSYYSLRFYWKKAT